MDSVWLRWPLSSLEWTRVGQRSLEYSGTKLFRLAQIFAGAASSGLE